MTFQSVGPPPLRVEVRDIGLNRIGVVSDMIRIDLVQTFNAVGRWQLELPPTSSMIGPLKTPGSGILVIREDTGAVTFSGSTESPQEQFQADTGSYTFQGRDDMGFLADRVAVPNPANPLQVSYMGNVFADLVYYAYNLWETAGQGAFDSGPSATVGTFLTNGLAGAIDNWARLPSPIADDRANNLSAPFTDATGSMRHSLAGILGSALTVELWFYPTWGGADSVLHGLWQNHDDSVVDVANGVSLAKQANNQWLFRVTDATGANHDITVSATSGIGQVVANTWHHVVAAFDSTGSSLYLNGVLIGTIGAFTLPTAGLPAGQTFGRLGWARAASINSYLSHYAIYGQRLSTVQVAAHYLAALTQTFAFDTRTGDVETVIRGFADANCGATAVVERRVLGFALGTYNALGIVLTEQARYGNLLDLLRGLAIKGATASIPLGIRFQQVIGTPSHLVLDVYAPRDLTARVIYSPNLQNIVSYTRTGPVAPSANYVYVGGAGLLADRVIVGGQDATSVATWGRREVFRDARSSTDATALAQTVAAELVKGAGKDDLTLEPLAVAGLIYGQDFGLGDQVSVVTSTGDLLQEVVYEVETTIDATGMSVRPSVGPPAALDSAQGQGDIETIDQRIAKLETQ